MHRLADPMLDLAGNTRLGRLAFDELRCLNPNPKPNLKP